MTMLNEDNCAVILVNHDGSARTLACLRALARFIRAPRRIVVVDNSQDPGEVPRLLDGWGAIAAEVGWPAPVLFQRSDALPGAAASLMALPENLGFAAGNNAALKLLLGDPNCSAFWLLNNDTEPMPTALKALCARLNQRPEAGLCGSTVVLDRGVQRLQCAAGGTFTPWLAATRHLGQGADLAELPNQDNVERNLDYIIGASLLVRREVLERTGLLPEEYFLYCEDVDFCLSARRAGFGLAWARDSFILHHEGASTGAQHGNGSKKPLRPRLVDYLAVRNRFHLVRKFRPSALPVALLTLPLILANRVRRGQMARCELMLQAMRDALSGRMGRPRYPL